jgi:glyoxylase-like metal-dependent hydrolase (beta-lactamase superfamily II)
VRSAAWAGETDIQGQKADIVEFSWDETQRLRLIVGRQDNRVRYLESINPDPVTGDAATVVHFEGDNSVAGLWFPARIKSFRRGARLLELEVNDIKVNEAAPAGTFEIDRAFKELQPEKIETVALGGGLYEIKGLGAGQYRSQFIVMDDFVVGFEALLGYPASSQILAEIKKVAPDKPVKYIVLSHFHADHAGGIGVYGEIGAKIVTAPENRDVLTAYANARSALTGQPRLRAPIVLDFAFVQGDGMDITDRAGRTLRIVNFRNTPHVASVLAIYDATTKTVVNGDLYSDIVRYNRTFDVFVDWLKTTKLEIDWILGTHHPRIARADLLATAAVERRKRLR